MAYALFKFEPLGPIELEHSVDRRLIENIRRILVQILARKVSTNERDGIDISNKNRVKFKIAYSGARLGYLELHGWYQTVDKQLHFCFLNERRR